MDWHTAKHMAGAAGPLWLAAGSISPVFTHATYAAAYLTCNADCSTPQPADLSSKMHLSERQHKIKEMRTPLPMPYVTSQVGNDMLIFPSRLSMQSTASTCCVL
ncbi:hypothetical protein ABBQ38_008332 [Trebouxia sp. C0009 RCD-2024]